MDLSLSPARQLFHLHSPLYLWEDRPYDGCSLWRAFFNLGGLWQPSDIRPTVSTLILDRIELGAQAGFYLWRKLSLLITIYSRRCLMQKLIVIGFAALCLIGTSSLALADEPMMGGMGNMKGEMKAEKDAMKSDGKAKKQELKGQPKAHKEKMKAKNHETKGKMKAHKQTAKAKVGGAKGTTPSVE
jgi:Sec-independent protein translocase protein TatA